MKRGTFDIGIDLGTTSAKMACCRSGSVEIIPNREGAKQTPCAVWLNSHGQFVIGQKAKEALATDPDNVQVNFIRDLGSGVEYTFPRSSRRMKPEELTAELLKSLRIEAEQFAGREIRSAVITIQPDASVAVCAAIKRAASVAGFEHCLLLQDAMAVALAAGATSEVTDSVLIYDFGGNQFNASVLQVREGIFQVTTHAGDSFIGGVNLDRSLVETVFIPALKEAHPELNLAADNPKTRALFAKLQAEGEAAKLRLGHANATSVFIPNLGDDNHGQPIDFHCELTRAHLERLAAPLVESSIRIYEQVLAEAHITASGISNVIPVGGMVAMPFVRQRLEHLFGQMAIPISPSVDPTTAVVRGAAMFAGMQNLPDESKAIRTQDEFEIELDYQPVTSDSEPLISGLVRAHDTKETDLTGFSVEFSKVEPQEWHSGKVGLSEDGRFIATLLAAKAQRNTFRIELSDAAGLRRIVGPNSITITVASASIANVGLTHSIGLALSENEVLRLFEKGALLPARRDVSLRTVMAFSQGQSKDLISFPLVEGENHRADRNRKIGIVTVPSEGISRDLPPGTEVDIAIEIDVAQQFRVTTYIPILDEEFEHRIALHANTPTSSDLAEQLQRLKARLGSVRERIRDDAPAAKKQIATIDDGLIANVERLLMVAEHDADAASQCAETVNTINSALDDAENALEWPDLVEEAKREMSSTHGLLTLSDNTTAGERVEMTDLERAIQEAIDRRDELALRKCLERVHSLYQRLVVRYPAFWRASFEQFRQQSAERQLPANAQELITAGNRAISRNDLEGLKNAVRGLHGLLAPACSLGRYSSTLTTGNVSVSNLPTAESRESFQRNAVDRMVQRAVDVFNQGQENLKHQHSEIMRRQIFAGFESARADLLRAAELGSVRARENLQIADNFLARVRDGSFGLSNRVLGCIQEAGEAAAREDWHTAVDKLRTAMDGARPTVPEAIKMNLAVALANRGVASANKLGSILAEERGVLSAWKPPTSATLSAAVELAKQARRDLEEAAEIDSKSGHIQENLRKLNEILSQISEFRSYGSGAHSVEAPRQGPRTSWLKELKEKLWPAHEPSQPPDDDLAEKQDRNAATTKEKVGGTPLEVAATKGHKDIADLLLTTKSNVAAKDRGTPEVPGGRIDDVHFSVTSPRCVLPGYSFILNVWAHLKRQRQAVIKQAREAIAGGEIVIQSKGPIQVARGTVLSVLLKIDSMSVNDPQDTIYWKGEIGNARFPVTVPDDAKEGSRAGLATIYLDGVQIAKIHFSLMVGKEASSENDVPFQVNHHRKAFASYASQDRNDVLTSIQGMQKADPGLDVFYDEANLRSGASWEQELKRVIPESDVFYLFWSASAKASQWVDMEWRWALERRGIEFIDPVPLVSPDEVPPPEELGGKHFKDWVLAYRRRRP